MLLLDAFPLFFPLLAIGSVAAFLFAGWYLSPYRRVVRAMRSVPHVPVAEAVDGSIVRIVGTLREGGSLLRAPLSGRPCAAFSVLVEERPSGKKAGWRRLVEDTAAHEFLVEDETGTAHVRIRTHEGKTAIVFDHHASSGFLHDASPEIDAFLESRGHRSTNLFGLNRALRYKEGVLEPGEQVAVVGRARWIDDPNGIATADRTADYRAPAQRRRALVLEASELSPVQASDDYDARVA